MVCRRLTAQTASPVLIYCVSEISIDDRRIGFSQLQTDPYFLVRCKISGSRSLTITRTLKYQVWTKMRTRFLIYHVLPMHDPVAISLLIVFRPAAERRDPLLGIPSRLPSFDQSWRAWRPPRFYSTPPAGASTLPDNRLAARAPALQTLAQRQC